MLLHFTPVECSLMHLLDKLPTEPQDTSPVVFENTKPPKKPPGRAIWILPRQLKIALSYVADPPRGFASCLDLEKVMKRQWGSRRDTKIA